MLSLSNALRKSSKAYQSLRFFCHGSNAIQEDLNLLKILQSEINHELTSEPSKNDESGSLGDFVMEWDSLNARDVFLRKKCKSGEEVAISALLSSQIFEEDSGFPAATDVEMKVCIKKPGLSSILQFDCEVSSSGEDRPRFGIQNAYYLQSASSLSSSLYRGPLFSNLEPQLQDELKKYLEARGIGKSLLNFLLFHLQKKEHGQYVNWLQKLESATMQASDEDKC